jgi:hypothetical protein
MAALDSIRPYVEELFDDSDVQSQLTRAGRNLRAARSRAGSAKSKRKAVQDARLRRQLANATRSLILVAQALDEAPDKQRRKRRRGRVLLLLTLAAGGAVAANADARAWVQQQFGGGGPEPA